MTVARRPLDLNGDSYVYRIYDEFGRLLYVGCSINPIKRLMAHARSDWIDYALKVDVRGPWPRPVALKIETAAIHTESPYFNAQPEHTRSLQLNQQEAERRMRRDGLERFDDNGNPRWDWYDEREAYVTEALRTHPVIDAAERLKRYLAQRVLCEQAAS